MVVTEKVVGIQTHNNQTGLPIEVKTPSGMVKKVIITTASGRKVWAPLSAVKEGANTISYNYDKAGDTFVATRDSSRVWAEGMVGYTKENEGTPLYEKGDTVKRQQDNVEFISLSVEEVFTPAAKEKMEFAAKLGLAVKI